MKEEMVDVDERLVILSKKLAQVGKEVEGGNLHSSIENIKDQLKTLAETQTLLIGKSREQDEETAQFLETQNDILQNLGSQLKDVYDKLEQLSNRNNALLRKVKGKKKS